MLTLSHINHMSITSRAFRALHIFEIRTLGVWIYGKEFFQGKKIFGALGSKLIDITSINFLLLCLSLKKKKKKVFLDPKMPAHWISFHINNATKEELITQLEQLQQSIQGIGNAVIKPGLSFSGDVVLLTDLPEGGFANDSLATGRAQAKSILSLVESDAVEIAEIHLVGTGEVGDRLATVQAIFGTETQESRVSVSTQKSLEINAEELWSQISDLKSRDLIPGLTLQGFTGNRAMEDGTTRRVEFDGGETIEQNILKKDDVTKVLSFTSNLDEFDKPTVTITVAVQGSADRSIVFLNVSADANGDADGNREEINSILDSWA